MPQTSMEQDDNVCCAACDQHKRTPKSHPGWTKVHHVRLFEVVGGGLAEYPEPGEVEVCPECSARLVKRQTGRRIDV